MFSKCLLAIVLLQLVLDVIIAQEEDKYLEAPSNIGDLTTKCPHHKKEGGEHKKKEHHKKTKENKKQKHKKSKNGGKTKYPIINNNDIGAGPTHSPNQ